jgi:hypothetical protein
LNQFLKPPPVPDRTPYGLSGTHYTFLEATPFNSEGTAMCRNQLNKQRYIKILWRRRWINSIGSKKGAVQSCRQE